MKILLIILGLIYVLSLYDFFPDFIIGWGWLDDLIILGLLWRYLKTLSQKQFEALKFYHQSRQFYESERDKGFSEKKLPARIPDLKKQANPRTHI